MLVLLIVLLLLAGACWGWSQFRQGKDNPDAIKMPSSSGPTHKKTESTNKTPAVNSVPEQAPISEPGRVERQVKSTSRDKKLKVKNETNMPAEAAPKKNNLTEPVTDVPKANADVKFNTNA
ncbi:MAG: hypothetical protein ACM3PE_13505 [Deltaproteobacteria bacterium]